MLSLPVDWVMQASKHKMYVLLQFHSTHTFVLRSSGISWKLGILIVRYSQNGFLFVFYCFKNPSTARNFETTDPDSGGVFNKMYFLKWALQSNKTENVTYSTSD